jgi:hypothetical protein
MIFILSHAGQEAYRREDRLLQSKHAGIGSVANGIDSSCFMTKAKESCAQLARLRRRSALPAIAWVNIAVRIRLPARPP